MSRALSFVKESGAILLLEKGLDYYYNYYYKNYDNVITYQMLHYYREMILLSLKSIQFLQNIIFYISFIIFKIKTLC